MKISGKVIQDSKIRENTDSDFLAYYKGKEISITTDHGHGPAKWDHLKRYSITVIDLKSGGYDVNTWEDKHNMKDAIRFALKGACLLD